MLLMLWFFYYRDNNNDNRLTRDYRAKDYPKIGGKSVAHGLAAVR